jgi:hypothetical protein
MTLTSRAVAAAGLALALALPAGAADARGNHWSTVTKVARAKLQACKVATTPDGPWRIRLRVNATDATAQVRGSAMVQKNGEQVGDKWRSGHVHQGDVSKIGKLRLPRGSAYQLEGQLETDSSGSGAVGSAAQLHRC